MSIEGFWKKDFENLIRGGDVIKIEKNLRKYSFKKKHSIFFLVKPSYRGQIYIRVLKSHQYCKHFIIFFT